MKKNIIWGVLALLVAVLSCGPFTPTDPAVVVVTATSPAPAPGTDVVQPAAGEAVRGLAAFTGDGLTFYDRNGGVLFKVPFEGEVSYLSPSYVHIAGNHLDDTPGVPVIYHSYENQGSLMLKNVNGPTDYLVDASAFAALAGAPGQPVFAYTRVSPTDMMSSSMYVGSLAALPSSPVLTSQQQATDGWPFKPLTVDAQNGQPVGIWYTTMAYGIGGDIVFEPRKGLFYLDVASGSIREILNRDYDPSCLSSDKTWVAYTPSGATAAGLTLYNIQNGANIAFPLLPSQEQRGAGYAVISPGNRYVAWMEASGWTMSETPTFQSTVRVGDFNGNVIAEYVDNSLTGVSGMADARWAEPVAWLDDQTLIIQVRGEVWDNVALVKYDTASQALTYYGSGSYIGLLYP